MAPAPRHARPRRRRPAAPHRLPVRQEPGSPVAQAFLTWTVAVGIRPSALTQAHIDAYYQHLPRLPAARRPRIPHLGRRARPHPGPPRHPPPEVFDRAGHHPETPPRTPAPLRHRRRRPAAAPRRRLHHAAAPASPPGPRTRHRRRPRIPPHHNHTPARQRRSHLEPLREQRPRQPVTRRRRLLFNALTIRSPYLTWAQDLAMSGGAARLAAGIRLFRSGFAL